MQVTPAGIPITNNNTQIKLQKGCVKNSKIVSEKKRNCIKNINHFAICIVSSNCKQYDNNSWKNNGCLTYFISINDNRWNLSWDKIWKNNIWSNYNNIAWNLDNYCFNTIVLKLKKTFIFVNFVISYLLTI